MAEHVSSEQVDAWLDEKVVQDTEHVSESDTAYNIQLRLSRIPLHVIKEETWGALRLVGKSAFDTERTAALLEDDEKRGELLARIGPVLAAVSLVSRRLCRIAGAAFVVAFLAAGATPATPAPLVGGAILAVTAWTVADHGLGLAAHVGREAGTARNELVHAAASLLVGAAAGAVAYGASLVASGGQPVTALVFLLFGGVVILVTLRE